MIALAPTLAQISRWDLGGVSINFDSIRQQPIIYIYDAYKGGIGIKNFNFLKNEYYHKFNDLVFLEGYENIPCSSEGYAEYIMREYEEWDWKEHILGDFWGF